MDGKVTPGRKAVDDELGGDGGAVDDGPGAHRGVGEGLREGDELGEGEPGRSNASQSETIPAINKQYLPYCMR